MLDTSYPPDALKDIAFDLASGGCGVAKNGTGYCLDENANGRTFTSLKVPVPEGVTFQSISGEGPRRWCGIEKSGAIRCYSHRAFLDKDPKVTVVSAPGGRAFRSVTVNDYLVCGITVDSALYCWGRLLNYENNEDDKDYGIAPVLITRK